MITLTPDLEQSIEAFLRNDITLASVCQAFAPAEPADHEALPRLAAAAFGRQTPSEQVVSELAAWVDRWGSFIARQGMLGALFVRLGRYEDALRTHLRALSDTPRWHAAWAYRILEAIADDLLHLDRPQEAARVAELALRWDPTNPYVLLVLGCAAAKSGARRQAGAIHAYLTAKGYPMTTWGAALPCPSEGEPAAPYEPALQSVAPLSEDEWIRFASVNELNPFADREERIRAHAIACLARGRYDEAAFASVLAPAWQSDRSPFDEKVIRPWATARVDALEALPEAASQIKAMSGARAQQFSFDPLTRGAHAEACARAGDVETLTAMLYDPDRDEALLVAKELFKLDYDAHRPLVERMAEAEKLTGRRRDLPGISATKLLASLKKGAAAKKAAAPAKAAKGKAALRGVALVQQVIAQLCTEHRIAVPKPVPADALATLTFPNGAPLSPGLRTFLAFDARELGLLADPAVPRFQARTVDEVAARQFDRPIGALYEGTQEELPGACFVLGPQDGNRCDVLYVGTPDSAGEYPVLTLDGEEGLPNAYIAYPGIDVYLAHRFGVLDFDPERRKADDRALDEQRRLNLGGRRALCAPDDDG